MPYCVLGISRAWSFPITNGVRSICNDFGLKGLTYRDLNMLLGGEFSFFGRFGHFRVVTSGLVVG